MPRFCFFLTPKRKSPSAAASRGKTASRIREDNFTSLVLILNNLIIPQCDKPEEVM